MLSKYLHMAQISCNTRSSDDIITGELINFVRRELAQHTQGLTNPTSISKDSNLFAEEAVVLLKEQTEALTDFFVKI